MMLRLTPRCAMNRQFDDLRTFRHQIPTITPTRKEYMPRIFGPTDDETLRKSQELGAATYLTAYIVRMARAMDIDPQHLEADTEAVNQMVLQMVEPLNHATAAIWCALMTDASGRDLAIERLTVALEAL